MSALSVRDLHKSFAGQAAPVEVLRGVSFDLAPGEALAITGPSGSGKSTLLHLIGTLDRPTSGTVEIGGADPFRLSEPELARFRNRSIGFVFQDSHLLPQYSVLENVLVPTLAFPEGKEKAAGFEARARELLERVGLSHRLDHRPAELSGGERQRAAVARALVQSPGLLLCDEPTGSLDRKAAQAVAGLLFELHEAERTVLVVVTHSLELAGRFARRFELAEGRIAA
ncbi:MAG TPA: ABC transporter ATP-binding protein [Thermoanaerobaculia bacterium]|nr:ABC transporter ATP-binding protein [Thermoanaerobaculia bacterium]